MRGKKKIQKEIPFKSSEELVAAIEKFDFDKKVNKMDLSSDQDLTLAIMNLVSIEEHFFFSGGKTGQKAYYDMIDQIRDMRKTLLKKILKDPKGEEWCICKHLLAACMRLMEVGTKQLHMGNKKEAYDLFDKGYELYALFWGLAMKLVDIDSVQMIGDDQLDKQDKKRNFITKPLGALIQKIIDCCIE